MRLVPFQRRDQYLEVRNPRLGRCDFRVRDIDAGDAQAKGAGAPKAQDFTVLGEDFPPPAQQLGFDGRAHVDDAASLSRAGRPYHLTPRNRENRGMDSDATDQSNRTQGGSC